MLNRDDMDTLSIHDPYDYAFYDYDVVEIQSDEIRKTKDVEMFCRRWLGVFHRCGDCPLSYNKKCYKDYIDGLTRAYDVVKKLQNDHIEVASIDDIKEFMEMGVE